MEETSVYQTAKQLKLAGQIVGIGFSAFYLISFVSEIVGAGINPEIILKFAAALLIIAGLVMSWWKELASGSLLILAWVLLVVSPLNGYFTNGWLFLIWITYFPLFIAGLLFILSWRSSRKTNAPDAIISPAKIPGIWKPLIAGVWLLIVAIAMGVFGSWGLVSTMVRSKNDTTLGGLILGIYVLMIAALCGLAGVLALLRKKYTLAITVCGVCMFFSSFITLPSFILLILSKNLFLKPNDKSNLAKEVHIGQTI